MEKYSRGQRIGVITKKLIENPNKVIGLNYFTERLNAAKSTTSEDIVIIKDTFKSLNLGKVETVAGASGGVKYVCSVTDEMREEFVSKLCKVLGEKERVIIGDFLYMTDILYDPDIISKAGHILASIFIEKDIDYVVTVETKGIPLAYEVAKMLGVKLVIVRRDNKVTEGTTVSINYVSGSSKRIQSMSLSKKSLNAKSNCLFIDDFMKAGGTAKGIADLIKEFDCNLIGTGVLIDNVESSEKIVDNYISLIKYYGIDNNVMAILKPSII